MRADVQKIFKKTPCDKQVMMFSATLPNETKDICKKFMRKPVEIIVIEENKEHLEKKKKVKNCLIYWIMFNLIK